MDAEPRLLRPFILVATFFVVFGSAATYYFWFVARQASIEATPLHAVAFLDRTSAVDRERLSKRVDDLLGSGTFVAGWEGEGEDAVPPLLDAIHRLSLGGPFDDPAARARFALLDGALLRVSGAMSASGGAPVGAPPTDAAGVAGRASAWFYWWDAREKRGSR